MENFNDVDIMHEDDLILQTLIDDECHRYENATDDCKDAILNRIERLARVAHQQNEDVLRLNQLELEQEKLEETKRQFDENQQREIERSTDDKEIREADIQIRRDNLLITESKNTKDLIIDVAKIAVPVGMGLCNFAFIGYLQTKSMVWEENGNIFGRSAIGQFAKKCIDNYARRL